MGELITKVPTDVVRTEGISYQPFSTEEAAVLGTIVLHKDGVIAGRLGVGGSVFTVPEGVKGSSEILLLYLAEEKPGFDRTIATIQDYAKLRRNVLKKLCNNLGCDLMETSFGESEDLQVIIQSLKAQAWNPDYRFTPESILEPTTEGLAEETSFFVNTLRGFRGDNKIFFRPDYSGDESVLNGGEQTKAEIDLSREYRIAHFANTVGISVRELVDMVEVGAVCPTQTKGGKLSFSEVDLGVIRLFKKNKLLVNPAEAKRARKEVSRTI